ncbi:MAG: hypothetical protein IPP94_17415 [Ignavibacteria bacterium]|nr:hypothetical protein [Ignavibacteria bacterium]
MSRMTEGPTFMPFDSATGSGRPVPARNISSSTATPPGIGPSPRSATTVFESSVKLPGIGVMDAGRGTMPTSCA